MVSRHALRPSRSLLLPGVLAALALVVTACGGGDLDLARMHLRRGHLDKAEAAMEGAQGRRAAELRDRIQAHREERLALSVAMEQLALLPPREERDGLRELLSETEDAWCVERLERAISKAADRTASEGSEDRVAVQKITAERMAARDRALMAEGPVAPEVPEVPEERGAGELQGGGDGPPPGHPFSPPQPEPSAEVSGEPESPAPSLEEPVSEPAVAVADPPAAPETEPELREPEPPAEEPPDDPVTAAEVLAPELARAETALRKARPKTRDEAWATLIDYGPVSEEYRRRALEERWQRTLKSVLKSPGLKMLERLAQDREELDFRREEALALIFDEEEYFYPYRPPECPPQKARLYWPVQKRVDDLVAELREVWDTPRDVRLSSSLREALDELRWCQARVEDEPYFLHLPEELPTWVLLLPLEAKSIGLQEFAWDAEEQQHLTNDQAVLAYNARLWMEEAQDALEDEQVAASEEQLQVRITNTYRRMFGRRVLAWNPRLQESSDGHSAYMARTGHFGHYEEGDEQRRTPFDRMRLAGYNYGVSENCHWGGGSAQGAHESWCKSSGHHRNLLSAGHTEMASAVDSGYWTQNFGTDKEYRSEIEAWLD